MPLASINRLMILLASFYILLFSPLTLHGNIANHANTYFLDNDEVYIPKRKSSVRFYSKLLNNPPSRVFTHAFRLFVGFSLYLLTDVSEKKYKRYANHSDPMNPVFTEHERIQILLSDAAILAAAYGFYLLAQATGLDWTKCIYGVPLLVMNAFFVLITY